MDGKVLQKQLLELIRRTSCELPPDVSRAVDKGWRREKAGTTAKYAFSVIRDNIVLAADKSQPICQDTGTIICYVDKPSWLSEKQFRTAYEKAIVKATKVGYLRQNSVDSVTGKNSGNNLGPGSPVIHFHEVSGRTLQVRMMLKGGGCENVGIQYSLPNGELGAGRDLEGVRRCILDAAHRAQGKGCGPGVLGVCIGGDRATGMVSAKEEFFRSLDDTNPDRKLGALEKTTLKQVNTLGVGPMGFGGETTLMGVKISARNRVPASFFVSISYMCWAYRRNGFNLSPTGKITKWLYA
jgi:tartrate/fumarate subfamily iron-sulfur-dependent hydro-lyase alpha chain